MLVHDFRQIEERTLGILCCAISLVFLFLDLDVYNVWRDIITFRTALTRTLAPSL